jgi:Tfp pilus assembly protein PilV
MKFLNQRGMSLVEVTVGMAIMVAGSAMYAIQSKNVAKNEASLKVRSAINQMGMEAVDYLKSRDICDNNMGAAFGNLSLPDSATTLTGKTTYKKLRGKGFLVNGVVQYKDIFTVDQSFEGGKIWVKDVNYKLENLQTVTIPNAPWNKSGDMKITVTFQRCTNGGSVYLLNNGVKTLRCSGSTGGSIVETNRIINKMAALKTTSGVVGQFACADSQDALIDAANKFTQEKFCVLEAKMLANNGMSGATPAPCNYTVTIANVEKNTNGSYVIPSSIVPKSIKVKMIGGGGGGGGGDRDEPGGGGKPGIYHEQALDDSIVGASCALLAGGGGGGGDGDNNATNGGNGGISTINCTRSGAGVLYIGKSGGGGGEGEARGSGESCGWGGVGSFDIAGIQLGGGGGGGCRENNGGGGGIGAGGGGGGDRWGEGGVGGSGFVKLSWKQAVIKDASGNVIP